MGSRKPRSAKPFEPDMPIEVFERARESLMETSDGPHAPIIYFESAPTLGTYAGVVRITLAAVRALPGNDGHTRNDFMVTGYLRCSLPAARELRNVLDRALLLATPTEGGA